VKAIQLIHAGDPPVLGPRIVPDPEPGPGEVLVGLRAAALNRRDAWLWRQAGYCPLPVTLGSDGAGVVLSTGDALPRVAVGDEVVINPTLNWGDQDEEGGDEFDILGAPTPGTFAELLVVPSENVLPKPPRLSWEEAAALNLAGLTAWRAVVTCGHVYAGQQVLVTGVGGGVATFALLIAVAHGATVFVTSSSRSKLERALELGAKAGYDYRDSGWQEQLMSTVGRGVDVVIDSAGPTAWAELVEVLRPGGALISFGATAGPLAPLDAFPLFWRWKRIIGTTMGSPRDYQALVEHAASTNWRPVIDSSFPLDHLATAARRLEAPSRFGKVVVTMS
jgi:NADPH:quinone reductase-like Zn-dependent oxidoreductase